MGLTLAEELTRPLDGFRRQLSGQPSSVLVGAFIEDELIGTSAVSRLGGNLSDADRVKLPLRACTSVR
ncbi:hypothetical protein [Cupriavidus basilensis]|uniref:hypothetical protein n=1 Tax=Cupriavidus basilensis TaxID=68895 RepID=UPI0023E889F2|nr:hypothetical protein [Cupriavidus basilensis]MDF3889262.1 hypothetical protein [Cupriavidus basilensis]